MKNAKMIMIATEEVVFPYECGKLRVTEDADIIAIQRAVAKGERIVLVPIREGERPKDGDIGIPIDIEQFIYLPEDTEGAILMYKTATCRNVVHEMEFDGIATTVSLGACPFYTSVDEDTLRAYFEHASMLYNGLAHVISNAGGNVVNLEFDSVNTDIDAIVIWLKTANKYLFFTEMDTEKRLVEFAKALEFN